MTPSASISIYRAAGLRLALAFFAIFVISGPAGAELARETLLVETAQGNSYSFTVEIADTPDARGQGLMFRKTLAEDAGMLFDFGEERPVFFWMKNTYVSLDMIFADSEGKIVRIAKDTTPLSLDVVPSNAPTRFVLEVPSGTSERLGINEGDLLKSPTIDASR
ncbi:DUF192 domain-containing protein [Rhizobiales bacterium]|uniref:DUF192 domain-containing protein n=1 Tax=Hongsoonwoonella zoysiae TaxID=2821844 RepID=UPI001561A056|nr:DUF192 domain-containing protein [Hongsoonwoonella zoysiae]NRG18498.1 DUF192 domain-containing protein [Hongsoonwoonella zoysiae]